MSVQLLLLEFECCCEKAIPLGVKVCPDCEQWNRELMEAVYGPIDESAVQS